MLLRLPAPATRKGMKLWLPDRLRIAPPRTHPVTLEQIQQREGRWVIANLMGKGRRVSTVPVPSWAKPALDAWTAAAGLHQSPCCAP